MIERKPSLAFKPSVEAAPCFAALIQEAGHVAFEQSSTPWESGFEAPEPMRARPVKLDIRPATDLDLGLEYSTSNSELLE